MSLGKFEHNKKIHLMTSQPGFVLSPICNMSCRMLSNLRHIQLKKWKNLICFSIMTQYVRLAIMTRYVRRYKWLENLQTKNSRKLIT